MHPILIQGRCLSEDWDTTCILACKRYNTCPGSMALIKTTPRTNPPPPPTTSSLQQKILTFIRLMHHTPASSEKWIKSSLTGRAAGSDPSHMWVRRSVMGDLRAVIHFWWRGLYRHLWWQAAFQRWLIKGVKLDAVAFVFSSSTSCSSRLWQQSCGCSGDTSWCSHSCEGGGGYQRGQLMHILYCVYG